MITDSLITNFIKDFAKARDLDANNFVSIEINTNDGVKYTYVEPQKRVVHTVTDFT